MNQTLLNHGFRFSKNRAHAKEYIAGDVVIYSVPSSIINLVISPEDYLFMKDYECSKYHNSNLITSPKEQNNGERSIHYGYKIEFESIYSMNEFLGKYMKFKGNS